MIICFIMQCLFATYKTARTAVSTRHLYMHISGCMETGDVIGIGFLHSNIDFTSRICSKDEPLVEIYDSIVLLVASVRSLADSGELIGLILFSTQLATTQLDSELNNTTHAHNVSTVLRYYMTLLPL